MKRKSTVAITIKSKLNRKSGLMVVSICEGKTKIFETILRKGDTWEQFIPQPMLFENGFALASLPRFINLGVKS